MYQNSLSTDLQNIVENPESKDIFDLKLLKSEEVGDALFYIGTILAWLSAKQAEVPILKRLNPQIESQDTSSAENDPAKTLALASWLFLIASFIFAGTAYIRLNEFYAQPNIVSSSSNSMFIKGSEIATFGNFVKVIGFILAAAGNQIIADNPIKTSQT